MTLQDCLEAASFTTILCRKETSSMNIAMVDQKQVDAYLDRAQRFIDNVNTFKETLIERLQAIGQANPFANDVSASVQSTQNTPIAQTNPVQSVTDSTSVQSTVTADEVDIDALLGDLDLDAELRL